MSYENFIRNYIIQLAKEAGVRRDISERFAERGAAMYSKCMYNGKPFDLITDMVSQAKMEQRIFGNAA